MKSPEPWQASPQDGAVQELREHPHVGMEHVILDECQVKFIPTKLK